MDTHGWTVALIQHQLILFVVVGATVHATELPFQLFATRFNCMHSISTVGAVVPVVLEILQSALIANGAALSSVVLEC